MHANTHTTMALPTRSERRQNRAPSRPEIRQASCRPESRTAPACEPGDTTHPRIACGRRCDANRPETNLIGQRGGNQEAKTGQPNPETCASSATPAATATTAEPPASSPHSIGLRTAAEPWSPGSNRSRTPITAGPSDLPDDRPAPTKRRPSPHPRLEDEWSPGRMRGTTKPSWGEQFASRMRGESGMSTAEYAVGTLAAVAFAGVLLKVLTSGPVQSALSDLIERALS
jgi:hypothetical protein